MFWPGLVPRAGLVFSAPCWSKNWPWAANTVDIFLAELKNAKKWNKKSQTDEIDSSPVRPICCDQNKK